MVSLFLVSSQTVMKSFFFFSLLEYGHVIDFFFSFPGVVLLTFQIGFIRELVSDLVVLVRGPETMF